MNVDIEKLSQEELLELNRRIVRRLDYLHSLKTRSQLDRFEPGDRVSFQSDGRTVEGIVVRVNRKTLSVRTKDTHWNIHPRFLSKVICIGNEADEKTRNDQPFEKTSNHN